MTLENNEETIDIKIKKCIAILNSIDINYGLSLECSLLINRCISLLRKISLISEDSKRIFISKDKRNPVLDEIREAFSNIEDK